MGKWTLLQMTLGILSGFCAGIFVALAVANHYPPHYLLAALFSINAIGCASDARRSVNY